MKLKLGCFGKLENAKPRGFDRAAHVAKPPTLRHVVGQIRGPFPPEPGKPSSHDLS